MVTQFQLSNQLIDELYQFDVAPTAKLVLMYLTRCYNPGQLYVFPKQQTISSKLGISLASVKRGLKELINQSIIILEAKNKNRYKHTGEFFRRLNLNSERVQTEFKSQLNLNQPLYIKNNNYKKKENYFKNQNMTLKNSQIEDTKKRIAELQNIKPQSPLDMPKEEAYLYLQSLPPNLLKTPMNLKLIQKFEFGELFHNCRVEHFPDPVSA